MKSYDKLFSDLYDALQQDIVQSYPSLDREMERDRTRLHHAMSHEGMSFITISHPEMCTFFQKALAFGDIASEAIGSRPRGFGRKSSSDPRPAYLHGLLTLIFDEEGTLLADPDSTAIFFVRQWLLMAKKFNMECSHDRTESAYEDFLAIEARLPDHWPNTWNSDVPEWLPLRGHPLWGSRRGSSSTDLFGERDQDDTTASALNWDLYRSVCSYIRASLGTCDPWSLRPKHGPGAVSDPNGLKYEFRSWPEKLQAYFPWDFFAAADYGLYKIESNRQPDAIEHPSIVLAVPKTQKGPRIICKEPTAYQWMQGGLERWLADAIQRTDLRHTIDLRDQTASQRSALEASVDGAYATVDLSAASDRLSTRLVQYVFQGGDNTLLDALHACRSRWFRLGNEYRIFRKFAPMGSACTFPVQSIVFASLAIFAVMQTRGLGLGDITECAKQVRVFGDDIIIPSDAYPVLTQALTSCGLKVNESKSYHQGLFRESCGMDAFAGVDVTPAYVRQQYQSSNHTSLQAVVESSNNFFKKGLWRTSAALLKTVPESERKLLAIGRNDGGAVSLYSFMGTSLTHLRRRWNEHLSMYEYRTICVTSKSRIVRSDGDAGLVQFFNEEPDPDTLYESGQCLRPRSTKRSRWV